MNNKLLKNVLIIIIIFTIILMIADLVNITQYIKINPNNDWLGYIGAIIGGLLTLVGVLMTINYENKKRKEELSIQFKPIIQPYCKEIDEIDGFIETIMVLQNDIRSESKENIIKIVLKNKGRGETNNFTINNIDIIKSNVDVNLSIANNGYRMEKIRNEIVPDGYIMFAFNFPKVLYTKNNKPINGELEIKLSISYCDFLRYYRYTSNYIFRVKVEDTKHDNYKKETNTSIGYAHSVIIYRDNPNVIDVKSSFKKNN